jgi:serine protease Do
MLIAVGLVAVGVALGPQLRRTADTAERLSSTQLRASDVTGAIDAQTFRRIAEAQMPMVVNIRSESRRQTEQLSDFFGGDDPLRRFFGLPDSSQEPREEFSEGAGSGFLIDKTGLILTNNHVVAGVSRSHRGQQ